MSIFIPFRAFRPHKNYVQDVVSKPYDVLSASEARAACIDNDKSYYHVIKPEIDFPEDQDPFASIVYEKGKENVEKLIDDGILIREDEPCYYVYRLQMGTHTQTGLVGCCAIDDYFKGVIKKHELTKPKIEESRKKHITVSEFTYEPVFFSYIRVDKINSIVNDVVKSIPEYHFTTDDDIIHTVWKISDSAQKSSIKAIFNQDVECIYIADGHHRTAAGALAGRELKQRAEANGVSNHRYDELMCVLFPHDEVQILDYNRVVKDLNNLSKETFLEALSRHFIIEKKAYAYKPEAQYEISMYLDQQWYKLSAKPASYDNESLVEQLGCSILSNLILEPLLDIVDLRRDKRIDFVGGIRGLEELEHRVDHGDMQLAFAVYPISMNQLIDISDQGLILPPKVTWFEPKLRSGLFVHSLSGKYDLKPAEVQ